MMYLRLDKNRRAKTLQTLNNELLLETDNESDLDSPLTFLPQN